MRLLLLCALLGACVESRLVVCDDGTACPAGNVCVGAALGGCARPDQLTACDLKADGDECVFSGFTGQCTSGVCVACVAAGCPPPGPRDRVQYAISDGTSTTVEYVPVGAETGSQPLSVSVGPQGPDPLEPVGYDTNDGSFEVPTTIAAGPHRVVLDLMPVPLEIQWSASSASITIPRSTRKSPATVPVGGGYRITPIGLSAAPASPSIATTGVFTFDNINVAATGGPTFTYLYSQYAKPLAGPSGAPEAARGDWILVADWTARTASQSSYAGWAKTSVELMAGYSTPTQEPTWTTTQRTLSGSASGADHLPAVDVANAQNRITALGTLVGGTATIVHRYGVIPSPDLFAFSWTTLPGYNDTVVMIPFSTSTTIDTVITVADPSTTLGLTRAVYAGVWKSRVVSGVTLRSGLQAVTTQFSGQLTFDAPLAKDISLSGVELMSVDGVTVPASSGFETLTFTPEIGFSADDYVVVLAELVTSQLVAVRDYQVVAPSVTIDGSLLLPGHQYVFLITSRKGYPNAHNGDYQSVTYPVATATTASRAFTVQ